MLRIEQIPQLSQDVYQNIANGIAVELRDRKNLSHNRSFKLLVDSTKNDLMFPAIDDISCRPLGFTALHLSDEEDYGILRYCWVDEDLRHTADRPGIGIGSLLVRQIVDVCGKEGYDQLRLNATDSSIGFYNNFSYEGSTFVKWQDTMQMRMATKLPVAVV